MVIPEIPQLHEGLLGLHVKSTDIDNGSFNGNLVCGPLDNQGAKSGLHPSIEFDEPMNTVNIQVSAPDGAKLWDATYAMNGKALLSQDAQAIGGSVPRWLKICTPRGVNELYTMRIVGNGVKSGTFKTSIVISSNNSLAVRTPEMPIISNAASRLPRLPPGPILVRLTPNELNPMTYVNFM